MRSVLRTEGGDIAGAWRMQVDEDRKVLCRQQQRQEVWPGRGSVLLMDVPNSEISLCLQ
jgi:hypothetical protein